MNNIMDYLLFIKLYDLGGNPRMYELAMKYFKMITFDDFEDFIFNR